MVSTKILAFTLILGTLSSAQSSTMTSAASASSSMSAVSAVSAMSTGMSMPGMSMSGASSMFMPASQSLKTNSQPGGNTLLGSVLSRASAAASSVAAASASASAKATAAANAHDAKYAAMLGGGVAALGFNLFV